MRAILRYDPEHQLQAAYEKPVGKIDRNYFYNNVLVIDISIKVADGKQVVKNILQ
jgi:hypothetical protein